MIWAIRQLATPFRYLRIRYGHGLLRSKFVYDWVIPLILSVLTVWLSLTYSPHAKMFAEKSLIGAFQKLLEILVPFYIVALAAVAAFDAGGALDQKMKGSSAIIALRHSDGITRDKELTRRQFICYLFGYLSTASLVVYITILICNFIDEGIGRFFYSTFKTNTHYLKIAVLFGFMLVLWQIIVTTLLGIFFVADRLQFMDDPDL
jgi:hypothetical protein